MSAAYFANGKMVQLDSKADTDVVVTPEDVKDPEKLARLLQQALRENAEERRAWKPRRIWFRDISVTTLGSYRLEHRFGGRVNYHVERWVPASTGDAPLLEVVEAQSDANVLTLFASSDGTVTIYVEEAG